MIPGFAVPSTTGPAQSTLMRFNANNSVSYGARDTFLHSVSATRSALGQGVGAKGAVSGVFTTHATPSGIFLTALAAVVGTGGPQYFFSALLQTVAGLAIRSVSIPRERPNFIAKSSMSFAAMQSLKVSWLHVAKAALAGVGNTERTGAATLAAKSTFAGAPLRTAFEGTTVAAAAGLVATFKATQRATLSLASIALLAGQGAASRAATTVAFIVKATLPNAETAIRYAASGLGAAKAAIASAINGALAQQATVSGTANVSAEKRATNPAAQVLANTANLQTSSAQSSRLSLSVVAKAQIASVFAATSKAIVPFRVTSGYAIGLTRMAQVAAATSAASAAISSAIKQTLRLSKSLDVTAALTGLGMASRKAATTLGATVSVTGLGNATSKAVSAILAKAGTVAVSIVTRVATISAGVRQTVAAREKPVIVASSSILGLADFAKTVLSVVHAMSALLGVSTMLSATRQPTFAAFASLRSTSGLFIQSLVTARERLAVGVRAIVASTVRVTAPAIAVALAAAASFIANQPAKFKIIVVNKAWSLRPRRMNRRSFDDRTRT